MNKRKGNTLILLGILLLAAALGLTLYNMQTELAAGRSSRQVLGLLNGLRSNPAADAPTGEGSQQAAGAEQTAAGETGASETAPSAAAGQEALAPEGESPAEDVVPEAPVPDYIRYPEMEMPTVVVEEHAYIGTLCIPDLGLELPVMSEWSYPKLKIAPCRFSGSAYLDDLIIVAHNYVTHLRNIKTLPAGAEITFTDMAGNVFCYALAEIEILKPDQVEELMGTDYPLTLVTCTIGGETRVTARCIKTGEIPAASSAESASGQNP